MYTVHGNWKRQSHFMSLPAHSGAYAHAVGSWKLNASMIGSIYHSKAPFPTPSNSYVSRVIFSPLYIWKPLVLKTKRILSQNLARRLKGYFLRWEIIFVTHSFVLKHQQTDNRERRHLKNSRKFFGFVSSLSFALCTEFSAVKLGQCKLN